MGWIFMMSPVVKHGLKLFGNVCTITYQNEENLYRSTCITDGHLDLVYLYLACLTVYKYWYMYMYMHIQYFPPLAIDHYCSTDYILYM